MSEIIPALGCSAITCLSLGAENAKQV